MTTTLLGQLVEKHGSDKGGHSYTAWYERLLAPFRDQPVTLIEIGIGGYEEALGAVPCGLPRRLRRSGRWPPR